MKTKFVGRLGKALGLAVVAAGLSTGAFAAQKNLLMLSASIGQSAHSMASSFAKIVNTSVPDMNMTNQATGGFRENYQLMIQKKAQIAHMSNLDLQAALDGRDPLTADQVMNFRGLYTYNVGPFQIIVRADSNIHTFNDLKGKRITAGPAGGGTRNIFNEQFKTAGILGDVKERMMSTTGGFDALRDGSVDAVFSGGMAPLPLVMQVAHTTPIRLIGLPNDVIARLEKLNKAYVITETPANIYPNQDNKGPVKNANGTSGVFAQRDLDPETVYQIMKAVFGQLDEYRQSHPSAANISLQTALNGLVLPLHPGAVRFYREAGVNVPARLLPGELK